jgi:3-hydroxyisobutyrate dehydrogenase
MRLGAAGTSTRLKLGVTSWVLAVTLATAEAVDLAQALQLDPRRILEAVEGGGLDLPYFRMKSNLMLDDEFPASFALALAANDVRLVAEASAECFGRATDAEYCGEDMAATHRISRPS